MGETVEALVDAGKASAGPPLGPALGPSGVNVKEVINQKKKLLLNYSRQWYQFQLQYVEITLEY